MAYTCHCWADTLLVDKMLLRSRLHDQAVSGTLNSKPHHRHSWQPWRRYSMVKTVIGHFERLKKNCNAVWKFVPTSDVYYLWRFNYNCSGNSVKNGICNKIVSSDWFKSHPKDWRSTGSNQRPLDCKASTLTTSPRSFLRTSYAHVWYYIKLKTISHMIKSMALCTTAVKSYVYIPLHLFDFVNELRY